MSPEDELLNIAESQHAAIARWQARTLGLSGRALRWQLRSPRWQAVTSTVLRRAGSPRTTEQRLMIAVLDAGPGAVLSHESAAARWGLPGFTVRSLHVARPRAASHRRSKLAFVHELRAVPEGHVRVLDGIPLTSPALTLYQLAATTHPRRAERACDNAWSRGLLGNGAPLHRLLAECAEHGRNGTIVLREILGTRPVGYIPPASGLERRFAAILADGGEAPMRRQVDLGDGEDWVGRVDFKDVDLPLVVEINSALFHLALLDQQADAARYARLRAAGFEVCVFWDTDVWTRPHEVLDEIRRVRAALRRARAA